MTCTHSQKSKVKANSKENLPYPLFGNSAKTKIAARKHFALDDLHPDTDSLQPVARSLDPFFAAAVRPILTTPHVDSPPDRPG